MYGCFDRTGGSAATQRMTGIGATSPFARGPAKDGCPPGEAIRGRRDHRSPSTPANGSNRPIPALRHSRRGGQLRGQAAGRASPTRGGPSPECPRPKPPAPPPAPPPDRPVPHQRLGPARLARRAVSVKNPPNPNYISMCLWGFLYDPAFGGAPRHLATDQGFNRPSHISYRSVKPARVSAAFGRIYLRRAPICRRWAEMARGCRLQSAGTGGAALGGHLVAMVRAR
jgi:hypothetical protein